MLDFSILTNMMLVGLQGTLQGGRQLLVNLVHCRLDVHLNIPLCSSDAILD